MPGFYFVQETTLIMNRIITILVTIFILLLLYIWISHVWGSDNPRKPQQIVDATESEVLGGDDSQPVLDTTYQDNAMDEYSSEATTEEQTGIEETVENTQAAEEEEPEPEPVKETPKKSEPVKTEPKPKATPSGPPVTKTSQPITKPAASASLDEGKHLVIVGNFLQRVNADQRMQELKKAGFTDVEVVNFDLSEYHTVCAGRFEDVNEARRLVKKLKDYHKIDAYVRIGS